MSNNLTDRFKTPISIVSGGLVGDNLLSQLKADMILQNVFKAMFGNAGERIFIDKIPSYNETIFPLIEFYWGNEVFQDGVTILSGNIQGRILLPTKIDTATDTNVQRKIANCIQRFLGSKKHNLFSNVKGLTEFGYNSEWKYDRLVPISAGLVVPAIEFNIPYKFDLTWLRRNNEDVDYMDNLDAELVGWVEEYRIIIKDDNDNVIKSEEILSETGQTN